MKIINRIFARYNVVFICQGVGTVVSGTTLKGLICLNDTLMLGPDPVGQFIPIAVKSIHRKRMAVRQVSASQTASFALKKVCSMLYLPETKIISMLTVIKSFFLKLLNTSINLQIYALLPNFACSNNII